MNSLLDDFSIPDLLSITNAQKVISEKILSNQRITKDEAMLLYTGFDLGLLGLLSNHIKSTKFGQKVFFNQNIHIEPTNICIYNCKFCSYSKKKQQKGSYELTIDEIIDRIKQFKNDNLTEIHLVSGVHPDYDFSYYKSIIATIKKTFPHLTIKAYTAVELYHMISRAGLSLEDGLKELQQSGLEAIPGGGAEIFDPAIRNQICKDKITGQKWLEVHKSAHHAGLPTSSTMLYGHIESYEHRIDHMEKIRALQDQTAGFKAFIPLKYKAGNNKMNNTSPVSLVEDLKNYAISRIFLDNIPHIKAYWPMIGMDVAQLSLDFGVDDIDGTLKNSTNIYNKPGSNKQKDASLDKLKSIIKEAGKIPVERDTFYNTLNTSSF
jgi:aminodeoxyfutalosine synthase